MSTVLNIRGTNGSGKTTLVKKIIQSYCAQPITNEKGKVTDYVIRAPKLITAPGISESQIAQLRAHVDEAISDPDYTVITNYDVVWDALGKDTYILGAYETPTGGCDGIKTQDEICDRIRKYSALGNVLFEGLLVSGLFKRYNALALELPEHNFIFGFLDTPLEKCIQQTLDRRAKKGNDKPFDPMKTLEPKFRAIIASRGHLTEAGRDCRDIPHGDAAFGVVTKWLAV